MRRALGQGVARFEKRARTGFEIDQKCLTPDLSSSPSVKDSQAYICPSQSTAPASAHYFPK